MRDKDKTREQLINEINQLRHKVFESELQQLNQRSFSKEEILKKIQVVKDAIESEHGNYEVKRHQSSEELRRTQENLDSERAEYIIEKDQLKAELQTAEDNLKRERIDRETERGETQIVREKMYKESGDRTRFFSIISHDLRSPIITIVVCLNFILRKFEKMDRQEIREFLIRLDNNANNLLKLADSLLSWSTLQIGKFQCEWTNFKFEQIADENIQLFDETAKNKAIRIYSELEKDIMVYADYDMINAVIRNLFSNALKFTGQNGEVRISTEKTEEGIVVSVSDTGVGMSENVLNNIFQPSEKTTSRGTKGEVGTGFGLLLCEELIKKNEGAIWVESKEGLGTTVFFTLLEQPSKKANLLQEK
jgi:signal transduction histidine kinase